MKGTLSMYDIMIVLLSVACATFVIKTLAGWVKTSHYEKERKLREHDREVVQKALFEQRLKMLEK